jgi:limonene-1,2-epoxide hydrolase
MHAFRAAVEARDHDAMVAAMAPDVLFYSPVAHSPFDGREAVAGLFTALLDTFEDFTYTDEMRDGDTVALLFTARVGDKRLQGLDWLRLDEDGLVREFTVMIRPLSGIVALGEAMAPKVEGLAKAEGPV